MADSVEKRLEQSSLGGTPLLKPDEQNKYLGTFKERCVAVLTKEQTKKETLQRALQATINKHPGGRLLINDELASSEQEAFLQLALKEKVPFTIVNRDLTKEQTDVGVVYALSSVSGVENLDLEANSPFNQATPEEKRPLEKGKNKSFWKKLF